MILSFKGQFVAKILMGTKVHTIRTDKPKRWKAGMLIHFATGVRTKAYNRFKLGTCMSVQGIRIDPETRQIRVSTNGIEKVLPEAQHLDFMKRDGFDTEAEFWEWFNTYFEGVLIHWTPLVY